MFLKYCISGQFSLDPNIRWGGTGQEGQNMNLCISD